MLPSERRFLADERVAPPSIRSLKWAFPRTAAVVGSMRDTSDLAGLDRAAAERYALAAGCYDVGEPAYYNRRPAFGVLTIAAGVAAPDDPGLANLIANRVAGPIATRPEQVTIVETNRVGQCPLPPVG